MLFVVIICEQIRGMRSPIIFAHFDRYMYPEEFPMNSSFELGSWNDLVIETLLAKQVINIHQVIFTCTKVYGEIRSKISQELLGQVYLLTPQLGC